LRKQRLRHDDGFLDPHITACHLIDQPVRRAALDEDTEVFGTLDQDRRLSVTDSRMFEAPDRLTACVHHKTALQSFECGYASAYITAEALESLSL
jgi:hypothetical protein